ncbi:hypothetical protein [Cyclobacterium sp.]|uniref:hypothetical protein n=1 Tax=Cyclobacterium sp. TaxID=1966343 RepID=UPI0019A9478A|nr:hypothetical protein [Cyclobacterium sp.]MBD3630532.1 hypothetical protein [Cyclobacterium sp.]
MNEELYSEQKIQHRHSNYLIRLEHEKLEIDQDLEMTASIRLVFYTKDEAGEIDRPVLDVIREDTSLTESQKRNDLEMFRTRVWKSSTRGSMVLPTTGELVYPDEYGNYPEGAITQLQYWQSLPATAFPGETLAEKVYSALLVNMQEIYDLQNI